MFFTRFGREHELFALSDAHAFLLSLRSLSLLCCRFIVRLRSFLLWLFTAFVTFFPLSLTPFAFFDVVLTLRLQMSKTSTSTKSDKHLTWVIQQTDDIHKYCMLHVFLFTSKTCLTTQCVKMTSVNNWGNRVNSVTPVSAHI